MAVGTPGGVGYEAQIPSDPDPEIVLNIEIPPSGATVTLSITEGYGTSTNGYTGPLPVIVGRVYLGLSGPYFDGATPDDADHDYSWEGAADASPSKELQADGVAAARVTLEPRDWMVV